MFNSLFLFFPVCVPLKCERHTKTNTFCVSTKLTLRSKYHLSKFSIDYIVFYSGALNKRWKERITALASKTYIKNFTANF